MTVPCEKFSTVHLWILHLFIFCSSFQAGRFPEKRREDVNVVHKNRCNDILLMCLVKRTQACLYLASFEGAFGSAITVPF